MDQPIQNVLALHMPERQAAPLVVDSPHSGAVYPDDFGYACPLSWLQETEDAFVNELFGQAPALGVPLLEALFPRAYIDVNRSLEDIDAKLLQKPWPHPVRPGPRAEMGTGLIRRIHKARAPQAIYNRFLSVEEVQHRIDAYYHPYHKALLGVLDNTHERFGCAYHLNVHSMPQLMSNMPDIVLGDRDGTSCARALTQTVAESLRAMGYRVALNDPFKGVEIVRRYGRPRAGRHSLQVEIHRALYMDERTRHKHQGFDALRSNMTKLIEELKSYIIT